jgi:hypothetical protein
MAVDRSEMMHTAIGILTVAYEAVDKRGRGEYDDAEYQSAMALVVQNFVDFRMELSDVPEAAVPHVQRAAQAVGMEFGNRVDWLLGGLVRGYMAIVQAYMEDCPNSDIPAILQRTALNLPS